MCLFFTQCGVHGKYTGPTPAIYKLVETQTVLVEVTNTITPTRCENKSNFAKKEDLCSKVLPELPPIHGSHVGTGTFIKLNDEIVVLTAEHVCAPDEVPKKVEKDDVVVYPTIETKIEIKSRIYTGVGSVLKMSKPLDICVLSLDVQPNVSVPNFSRKPPERGARIYYAGAPQGFMSDTALMMFDGRYAGTMGKMLAFSMPCEHGTSGASVRNSKNQIFSIVQRVNGQFKHMCYGVSTEEMIKFLSTIKPK
tara:strand:- start:8891 stop:9643 length:753 start_codon:yes stop_codon:yes gene_type:complete